MGFTKIFNSIRSSTMLPSDIENVSLKRIIPKINEWNIDTVLITANRNFDTYNSLTPNWYYKVLR